MMDWLSAALLGLVALPLAYLLALAVASSRKPLSPAATNDASTFFALAIPAHDEASVISRTVRRLKDLNYPDELYEIHVVADHCTDDTANLARKEGAIVHVKSGDSRAGKGEALSWLLKRLLTDDKYQAVVIFDADTLVDFQFLRIMDARLAEGTAVIQGQHVISNPDHSWFAALTWAMFLVDNRFQNLGRSNLGLSAKNMGDAICLRADILRKYGWGKGLTEDYEIRQRLLLDSVKIQYEPAAKAYGEAPLSLNAASAQRSRWLAGSRRASLTNRWQLLLEGLRKRDIVLLDGALQAWLPSYSTLTLVVVAILFIQLLAKNVVSAELAWGLIASWFAVVGFLLAYPLFGLFCERAQAKAYLAITMGPLFILWRTWLAIKIRLQDAPVAWVRTAHGDRGPST